MTNIDKYGFSADRPITKIEDDLLGRAEFSENLCDAISQWKGKDSLVISLYGDWGTGKSSIKNMAISHLKKQVKHPTIIEFSPWEWSAQEKITQAFFDEISKSIGKQNLSENDKKLANIFKKYGNYLSASEVILNGTSLALPIIISVITGLGITTSLLIKDTKSALIITAILTFITSLISVSKWGAEKLKQLSSYYLEKSKAQEKNLQEIREELKSELSKRDESLLIVMDDLDRLTPNELRMIFQLVKANTDFPNVTFLLLFQKDIVEKKLSDSTQSGKDYLEKIIQIPFYTPKLEQSKVEKVLFNRLDHIINSNPNIEFDINRWGNIYQSGLKNYLTNLRNVYRFTSSLSFQFSLFNGKKVFEVNSIDLIAIECLRIFEPEAIKKLSNSASAFTTLYSSSNQDREKYKIVIENVINQVNEENQKQFKRIINELFPTIKWILENSSYDHSFYTTWYKDLRICHIKHFEKYFRLSLSDNEISASDFQYFIEISSDANKLEDKILELNAHGLLKEFLSQFESYCDQVPESSFKEYLYALFNTSDKVSDSTSGFLDVFSAQTHIFRLTNFCLNRISDKSQRGQLIINYLCTNTGLNSVARLLNSEEKNYLEGKETLFDTSDFNFIKCEFVRNIKKISAANPDNLLHYTSFLSLMYSWKKWGDHKDISNWFKSITTDYDSTIKVLSKFVQTTYSYSSGDYTSTHNHYIKIAIIEDFLDINRINTIISSKDLSACSAEEQNIILLFKQGLENKANGTDDH
ncbi:KAP family P-loop NTPase fold protein [Acinetobacter seifertii]|uniref:KAP family P-loop NTPase fold protein n=1 Tax=Acinetobacter seifertii TaxID=1530123 RepID=UPI0032B50294